MSDETSAPVEATLFAYQVGFGDCFLLRFTYADATRKHVMIDFGTTGLTVDSPKQQMALIANDVADKCGERPGDRLDVVVATHRHADHISGFATNKDGNASGDTIRKLKPAVVIQPWTEAPDAPQDWQGPEGEDTKHAFAMRRQSLDAMEGIARLARDAVEAGTLNVPKGIADQLHFIGEDNIANKAAVENLATMGDRTAYVFHGCDPGLATVLPGIEVTVLGPPTLRQTQTITKQKAKDKDEFWHLAPLQFGSAMGAAPVAVPPTASEGSTAPARSKKRTSALFPQAAVDLASKLPSEARWVSERVDQSNGDMMLGIVRALDNQMNNTSVILLFKAGSKKLLFPGDAQLENWLYALQSPLAAQLDDVDLYKVGHHGSLNATPKTMWSRLKKKSEDKDKQGRLTSVMSTRDGKHGHLKDSTEVPRTNLVKELKKESALCDTRNLPKGQLYAEVTFDLTDDGQISIVSGAASAVGNTQE